MAYPVIMGINLGTCVTTAMVCSIGSSRDAKRTGIVHIAFNTIGTIVLLVVMLIMQKMQVFGESFWLANVDSGGIANFQTVFNVITAVMLLPFTNQLVALSKAIVKDEPEKAPRHPELLGLSDNLMISPAMALGEATKAIAYMGNLARENFAKGCQMLVTYDEKVRAEMDLDEECLDQFNELSDKFLINLSKEIESEAEDRQLDMLMQAAPNFERVGDYAINLVELKERLNAEESNFSENAIKELGIISEAVQEILTLTVEAFGEDDDDKARSVEPLEEVIDDMVRILRDRHTKRLKAGSCSVSSGLVFMECLTYLERASDQCSSIALLMLARHNEEILTNHYDYVRHLHEGTDKHYASELRRRRAEYVDRLYHI